jgi:hypothetical protein
MVDSGATHHITPYHSDFIKWTPAQGTVSLGGHVEIYQMGIGTVSIRPSGEDHTIHLQNVMHIPDASACYFSVSTLMQRGGQIAFKDHKLQISLRGHQIAKEYQEGNLFWIDTPNITLHAIASTPVSITMAQ